MKLSVEFPSVSYREGPEAVMRLARAIERIGYDHIDVFDHVVMGIPIEGRPKGPYNPAMPILEAFMALSYMAAVTTRVTLGTEVLVLPQRQPALVAKQVSTLDTLSGGRVRLGVGVGWQESEYEALGQEFRTRGARMDEAIRLLRSYWTDAEVSHPGAHYPTVSMAMEPKPPQGARLPIWIGGNSEAALTRAVGLGDGLHLIDLSPAEAAPIGAALADRLRDAGRPRASFTLSLRVSVAANADARAQSAASPTAEALRRDREVCARAGVDYLVVGPRQATSIEQLEATFTDVAAALIG